MQRCIDLFFSIFYKIICVCVRMASRATSQDLTPDNAMGQLPGPGTAPMCLEKLSCLPEGRSPLYQKYWSVKPGGGCRSACRTRRVTNCWNYRTPLCLHSTARAVRSFGTGSGMARHRLFFIEEGFLAAKLVW